MKSKYTTYILMPVVVLIWAWIFIKIFSYSNDDEAGYQSFKKQTTNSVEKKTLDKYTLLLDYQDPFLRTLNKKNDRRDKSPTVKKLNSSARTSPLVKENKKAKIPVVSYHGMMSNVQKGKAIGFVTINSSKYMLAEGECKQGVSIVRIWKDSLEVSYEKNVFTVNK